MWNVLPGHGTGGDCGKTLIKSLSVQFHLGETTPPDSRLRWDGLGMQLNLGNAIQAELSLSLITALAATVQDNMKVNFFYYYLL